ncbi:MAG: hypothetical protein IJC94_03285 [Oscillospiraceae bacterium]|nr:hypothetical protein [Oscillospiraceae bacterium]
MLNRWIYKLEYKYRRFGISGLMLYIIIGMAAVFVGRMTIPNVDIFSYLGLSRELVFQWQVWRLVTFLLEPPSNSIIWIMFSLYFYYMIGTALEQTWGTFKFNVYYFMGALCIIIAAMISGYGYNMFLNMSLFFAFATLFPNHQVMLFFFIPIKIKWLAILDAVYFAVMFIFGGWAMRISIIMSLVNYFIFFGEDLFKMIKQEIMFKKNRMRYRINNRR